MKEYKQFGAYAIIIKNDEILLINKAKGPYKNKLDLPGGTIEFGEKPSESLVREVLEETNLLVKDFELIDADTVNFIWNYKKDMDISVHHTGIFYKVLSYENDIKLNIIIDNKNDDSTGCSWYKIDDLKESKLSKIAVLELKKIGYFKN